MSVNSQLYMKDTKERFFRRSFMTLNSVNYEMLFTGNTKSLKYMKTKT